MGKLTIMDVAAFWGLRFTKVGGKVETTCPNCGKTTVAIYEGANGGYFHCVACGTKGDSVSLWHWLENGCAKPNFNGEDFKNYIKSIREKLGNTDDPKIIRRKAEIERLSASVKVSDNELASASVRHQVYSNLIADKTLNPNHYSELTGKRGLTDEDIIKLGYSSVKNTYPAFTEEVLGVPGFYQQGGEWLFNNATKGILLPIRSLSGQIQGFQILNDRREHAKYIALSSSGKSGGTAAKSFVHATGTYDGVWSNPNNVIITEGVLKADIFYAKTGLPTLAVLGVNSTSELKPVLDQLPKGINYFLGFDMDKVKNIHVLKAEAKLAQLLAGYGSVYSLKWDPSWKGVDDYVLNLEEA